MRFSIVGTTASTRTRWRSIAARVALGSKRRGRTIVQPARGGDDELAEAVRVEEGSRNHAHRAGVDRHALEEPCERLEVLGAPHAGPLRGARGAGGEDHGAALLRRGRQGPWVTAAQLAERGGIGLRSVGRGDHPLERSGVRLADEVRELGVVDQHAWAFAAEHRAELGRGHRRVQHQRVRAELRGRDHRLDERDAVAAQDAEPVARSEPQPGKAAGDRIGVRLDLLVGDRALVVDQRRLVATRDRVDGEGPGRRRAPAPQGQADVQQPVGADRAHHSPSGEHHEHLGAGLGGATARTERYSASGITAFTVR